MPADLIYYTLIRDLKTIGTNEQNINFLKNKLLESIINNPNSKLIDLVKIAVSEPFGLRPQVAILLALYLIKDFWKDMMLFSNKSFIPSISPEDLFYSLLKGQPVLEYSFSKFDNENRQFLEELEVLFNDIPNTVREKSLSIRVCSGLYNWYLSLPVITQQMHNLSFSDVAFLNIISSSRTNPQKAITELINSYTISDINQLKVSIEENFNRTLNRVLERVKNILGVFDLYEWSSTQSDLLKKNNRFIKICNQKKSIIDEYSRDVENIEINKWTKSSFEKLENIIMNDIKLIHEKVDYDTIIINGKPKIIQDVHLSRKSKIAYENIISTINATRKYYSDMELEKIIINLLELYVK
jgi:hypothetical protein